MKENGISRRGFVKTLSGAPFAAAFPRLATAGALSEGAADAPQARKATPQKFVAIQVGARSFVDETVDGCLLID